MCLFDCLFDKAKGNFEPQVIVSWRLLLPNSHLGFWGPGPIISGDRGFGERGKEIFYLKAIQFKGYIIPTRNALPFPPAAAPLPSACSPSLWQWACWYVHVHGQTENPTAQCQGATTASFTGGDQGLVAWLCGIQCLLALEHLGFRPLTRLAKGRKNGQVSMHLPLKIWAENPMHATTIQIPSQYRLTSCIDLWVAQGLCPG